MPDLHYEHSRLADIYDLDSPWSVDREFYLSLAGNEPQDILDLGCGTGLICEAYAAKGHRVTGVDPAPAMLNVARHRPHGELITWVESSAQDYQSEDRFDLIIMTGHAFQTLLEDNDILDALRVMKKHLRPDGCIVFESRNPNIDWTKKWSQRKPHMLPGNVVQATWRFVGFSEDRMTFEWDYAFPDETLTSRSVLRFISRKGIQEHLNQAGLRLDKVLGDWDGSVFDETASEEMIFFVHA